MSAQYTRVVDVMTPNPKVVSGLASVRDGCGGKGSTAMTE